MGERSDLDGIVAVIMLTVCMPFFLVRWVWYKIRGID